MELSVVIPAYNEEKRIVLTLRKIGKYFTNSEIKCEVLVIVNNSTDKTFKLVSSISKIYPFIKGLEVNRFTGKGGAIAIGVKKAKGRYIAYQDADGSSNVLDLIKGLNLLKQHPNIDLAMGSRYMKHSNISGDLPMYRFVLSRLFNVTVRTMFGLSYSDTQCAVKVMKKHVAKKLLKNLVANKWAVDVNLLVDSKLNGFKVKDFPIDWKFKSESKLNIRSAFLQVFEELLSLKIYQISKMVTNIKNRLISANILED